MDFPWYKVKNQDECLTQGDIILSFPVPVVAHDPDGYPFFKQGYINTDVIIVTQACDMENRKTKGVTLCRVGSLEEAMRDYFHAQYKISKQQKNKQHPNDEQESIDDFDYNNIRQKSKRSYADKIRRGDVLDLYLLDKYNDGTHDFPYRVVYLRDSYRVPLDTLEDVVKSSGSPILRLLPPYREHLSHNFSFNFSRIGLPIDVIFEEDAF